MSFSTTFKSLRLRRGLTQEDVANALSITSQAVSRWECGTAMPDLSLLPQIAYMFDVTSDHLLGIDITRVKEEVEKIRISANDAGKRGNWEDALRILREGLKKYPNNYTLMNDLAANLTWSASSGFNIGAEQEKAHYDEALEIYEYVLGNCTDTETRNSAQFHYIYALHGSYDKGFDSQALKKMEAIIETLPSEPTCREKMRMLLMTREEHFEARKRQIFRIFYEEFPFYMLFMNENPHYTIDEQITAFEQIEKLYDIAFCDDDPYTYSWSNTMLYETGAELYLKKGDTENSLVLIRKWADESIRWDGYRYSGDSDAGAFTIKSILFRGISEKKGDNLFTNYPDNLSRNAYNTLCGETYSSLRGKGEFEAILSELDTNAKKYE